MIRADRRAAIGRTKKFWPEAPDLAVEVVSPSDRTGEIYEKVGSWLSAGTREVWIVNPRSETVTTHASDGTVKVLGPHDTLDGGDVLPGFSHRVADIFRFSV
jgi:Uma2 family endonuclease